MCNNIRHNVSAVSQTMVNYLASGLFNRTSILAATHVVAEYSTLYKFCSTTTEKLKRTIEFFALLKRNIQQIPRANS